MCHRTDGGSETHFAKTDFLTTNSVNSRIGERPAGPPGVDLQGFGIALCGGLSQYSVTIIGDMPIGEPVFLILAFVILLTRGIGPYFSATLAWVLFLTGMLMVFGYVVSDLVAETGPAQYLRGWARTIMLLLDCMAILVVASHGFRYLRWYVLGIALAILTGNMINLQPITPTSWKSGYGIAIGLVLAALVCSRLPKILASGVLIGYGFLCILMDSRSLGGIFAVAGLVMLVRLFVAHKGSFPVFRVIFVIVALLTIGASFLFTLSGTDSEHFDRRMESNQGRYIGIVVATRAIIDSPLIGYGSWAADKRYTQMLKQEAARASTKMNRPLQMGQSLLPHSQILQAWVEGGVLALPFFIAYCWSMARALFRLAGGHAPSETTPLLLVLLLLGIWNLLASPFLGGHRIYIMLVIGATALLLSERYTSEGRRQATTPPIPVGSGHRQDLRQPR